jgi:hypothetical protein
VHDGARPERLDAVLEAFQHASENSRHAFLNELVLGAEVDPRIRSFLLQIIETGASAAIVSAAAGLLGEFDEPASVAALERRVAAEPDAELAWHVGTVLMEYLPAEQVRTRLLEAAAPGPHVIRTWRHHLPDEPVPDEVLDRVSRTGHWQERLEALGELLRRAPDAPSVLNLVSDALEHDNDDDVFELAAHALIARGRRDDVLVVASRRLPDAEGRLRDAIVRVLEGTTREQEAEHRRELAAHATEPDEVNRAFDGMEDDDQFLAPVWLLGGKTARTTTTWWIDAASENGSTTPLAEDPVLETLLAGRTDGMDRLAWGARVLDRWEARGACLTALIRLRPDAAQTLDTARDRVLHDDDPDITEVAASFLVAGGQNDRRTSGLLLRRTRSEGGSEIRARLLTVFEAAGTPRAVARLLHARVAEGEFDSYGTTGEWDEAISAAHVELADPDAVRRWCTPEQPPPVRLEALALLALNGFPVEAVGGLRTMMTELNASVRRLPVDQRADPESALRVRCLTLLAELSPDDPEIFSLTLASAHHDPGPHVRAAATELRTVFHDATAADLPDDIPEAFSGAGAVAAAGSAGS